ncbi:hypothetical protein DUNSADRAFT_17452 [Dunaliella salina]|uniref:Encoded protein n=1 Tax=Dunaliella salina TaxID=3046 RepID=A0ABQ7G1R7_DUNSA|nr:hypothetical protein DUNSADRAFT_17452 [Dunaliella salina]|eukprot:KAF5828554.1 hypothetical protein DUNSADRAFT_17452 [Dunaliella salina]
MNSLTMRAASHSAASVSGRECCAHSSVSPNPCMSARHHVYSAVGTHAYNISNQAELLPSRRWPHQRTHTQSCLGPILSAEARRVGHRTYSSSGQQLGNLDSTSTNDSVYPLEKTKTLVETAMLAAVSGLAYLLSTILKLEASLGYFLPLPVVLAAMRGGPTAGWKTMMATGFLLVGKL